MKLLKRDDFEEIIIVSMLYTMVKYTNMDIILVEDTQGMYSFKQSSVSS